MLHHCPLLLRLSLVLLCCLPLQLLAQHDPGIIPGDILVMLTPEGDASTVAADLRTLDGVVTGLGVDHEASAPMRIWLLRFDPQAVPQHRMLEAVQRHPMVMMAQNDHPVTFRQVPNDPQYGQQWHHQNINSEGAWAITTGGSTVYQDDIVVCVIERSNLAHTDLIDNRWVNTAEIPGNGIDDDGNGYVDDHLGWNPSAGSDANVYGPSAGHGTSVAGMIGAKGNNGIGVVGANWDVKIMVVTVGSLTQANVIASYTYPLVMRRRYNDTQGQQGAFVVATNASWGIDNANPDNYPLWCALYDTLGTAGILNCGATANNNVNVDVVGDMPTACPSPFMVSVTATNSSDNRTFSAYGATTIDVGAPGASVRTTSGSTGYTTTSGTSFASPLTAGVIGLLYAAPCSSFMDLVRSDPEAGALFVRDQLLSGVDIVGNLQGQTVTGGRINAANSMQLMLANCVVNSSPRLALRAMLEGPFDGNLMRDDLRAAGLIPLNEPYGEGGESTSPAVLSVTGADAIVDWVRVELRDAQSPQTVVAVRHALLHRDGDVVDASDGQSPIGFDAPAGAYHVVVLHRNHLGCMTAVPIELGGPPVLLDLSDPATATWGADARKAIGDARVLWAGDVNGDGILRYTGADNDRDPILVDMGGVVPTNSSTGYSWADVNMDGVILYTGTSNDRDPILQNIGGVVPTATRTEQVP